MRSPKPYIVERKSRRRTTPDSAPASIWGNLDLGADLNDADDQAPGPAAKETPDRRRATLSLRPKPKS